VVLTIQAIFKGKWAKRKFACTVKSVVDHKVSKSPQGDDVQASQVNGVENPIIERVASKVAVRKHNKAESLIYIQ